MKGVRVEGRERSKGAPRARARGVLFDDSGCPCEQIETLYSTLHGCS